MLEIHNKLDCLLYSGVLLHEFLHIYFGGCILKVAFLSSAIGPRVAAACAHAALAALSENNSGRMSQIEALEHDNRSV